MKYVLTLGLFIFMLALLGQGCPAVAEPKPSSNLYNILETEKIYLGPEYTTIIEFVPEPGEQWDLADVEIFLYKRPAAIGTIVEEICPQGTWKIMMRDGNTTALNAAGVGVNIRSLAVGNPEFRYHQPEVVSEGYRLRMNCAVPGGEISARMRIREIQ